MYLSANEFCGSALHEASPTHFKARHFCPPDADSTKKQNTLHKLKSQQLAWREELRTIKWSTLFQYPSVSELEFARINGLLQGVRKQKDKYYEAKINREVSLDYCERKIAECIEEEEALEASLVRLGDKNDEELQLGLVVHELAYKSKEIYENALMDEKRLLLSQLFTNLAQKGLIIEPNLTPATLFLEKWVPKLNADYELRKTLENQGQNVVSATDSPVLLGD